MFNFEVMIKVNGQQRKVNIVANNSGEAKKMVQAQYSGCEVCWITNKGLAK